MPKDSTASETVLEADLTTLDGVLEAARIVARRYRELTGRPLGITGEVAEAAAATYLGLELAPPRQAGFDAVRHDGGQKTLIQIKGRRLAGETGARGRLGQLRFRHKWDAVLLVLLNEDFEVVTMHEASRSDVEKALRAPGSKARNERGQLSVAKFKAISRCVWSADSRGAGSG